MKDQELHPRSVYLLSLSLSYMPVAPLYQSSLGWGGACLYWGFSSTGPWVSCPKEKATTGCQFTVLSPIPDTGPEASHLCDN